VLTALMGWHRRQPAPFVRGLRARGPTRAGWNDAVEQESVGTTLFEQERRC
jgi:hypothetical protein